MDKQDLLEKLLQAINSGDITNKEYKLVLKYIKMYDKGMFDFNSINYDYLGELIEARMWGKLKKSSFIATIKTLVKMPNSFESSFGNDGFGGFDGNFDKGLDDIFEEDNVKDELGDLFEDNKEKEDSLENSEDNEDIDIYDLLEEDLLDDNKEIKEEFENIGSSENKGSDGLLEEALDIIKNDNNTYDVGEDVLR